MTSETLYILQSIADQLVASSTTFTDCTVGAFMEVKDGQVLLRSQGDNTELQQYGLEDFSIPQLYIRYREREVMDITSGEKQLSSDFQCQKEILPCRIVGMFEGEDMFEVLDNMKNQILTFDVLPFMNVDTVKIYQVRGYIDYINQWEEENMREFREHMPTLLSVALDIDIAYWRHGGCRQPVDLIP